jgi:hypothetical protein
MNFDWPHMLVTGLLIFAVITVLDRVAFYTSASKGKRMMILGVCLFVVLMVLNLLWPYGN